MGERSRLASRSGISASGTAKASPRFMSLRRTGKRRVGRPRSASAPSPRPTSSRASPSALNSRSIRGCSPPTKRRTTTGISRPASIACCSDKRPTTCRNPYRYRSGRSAACRSYIAPRLPARERRSPRAWPVDPAVPPPTPDPRARRTRGSRPNPRTKKHDEAAGTPTASPSPAAPSPAAPPLSATRT